MVKLDQRSFQHLRAIARQSIASSCLEPEFLWLGLLMDMLEKLAANVSDAWQQIEASFESTHHLDALNTVNATSTLAEKTTKDRVKDKVKNKEKDKEKDKDKDKEEVKNLPHFGYSIQLVKNISTSQECTFTAGQFRGESILLEERPIEERSRRKFVKTNGHTCLFCLFSSARVNNDERWSVSVKGRVVLFCFRLRL
jgi:hypothetical protein